ncbi:hypothetical protein YPPY13_0288, partial [Yersinia pestis PY-13]
MYNDLFGCQTTRCAEIIFRLIS